MAPYNIPLKQGRKYRSVSVGTVSVTIALILIFILIIACFDYDFLSHHKDVTRTKRYKDVKFGHGSFRVGRDSRYWDRDDRRRDFEYHGDESELSINNDINHSAEKDHTLENQRSRSKQFAYGRGCGKSNTKPVEDEINPGLYNEAGRRELKHYEALLKCFRESALSDGMDSGLHDEDGGPKADNDDGLESQDSLMEEFFDTRFNDLYCSDLKNSGTNAGGEPLDAPDSRNNDSYSVEEAEITDTFEDSPLLSQSSGNVQNASKHGNFLLRL